ncbi:hypothetical protein OVA24_12360 [Luteolibacter sp. SL250]|uniref:hypothetical protein n=1 Tax=Luteolibacter sp. SL250 TaxID=2995170 RepID=UPI00227070B0|nr:hypothetical protein [Luteolibacter sp. SL250]WAC18032.1 hypothetical protein OVA24_12360 [Luteolibacter sp. SL250]
MPSDPNSQTWRWFRDTHFPDDRSQDTPVFRSAVNQPIQIHQKRNRKLIAHASELDRLLKTEIDKLKAGINDPAVRGLIYIMYSRDAHGEFDPAYVGVAEKLGRSGNLSGPLARSKGPFSRFGYDSLGHIGGISDALFSATSKGYRRWPQRFFSLGANDDHVLSRPLFVWAKAWNSQNPVKIGDSLFPHCSLGFLEALLIFTLDSLYPNRLLNSKGMDRTIPN